MEWRVWVERLSFASAPAVPSAVPPPAVPACQPLLWCRDCFPDAWINGVGCAKIQGLCVRQGIALAQLWGLSEQSWPWLGCLVSPCLLHSGLVFTIVLSKLS